MRLAPPANLELKRETKKNEKRLRNRQSAENFKKCEGVIVEKKLFPSSAGLRLSGYSQFLNPPNVADM